MGDGFGIFHTLIVGESPWKVDNFFPLEEEMIRPDFEKMGGLVPVIAQDWQTGEVLMLAYMNPEAWKKTLETGKVHYFSRSRGKIWLKGESSGHVQLVKEIYLDCDLDTVLIKVEQVGGAACHKGYKSCFYRRLEGDDLITVYEKIFDPEVVYGRK
jgi:phosphoribosyl-AMP cyclohydrolase